MDKKLPGIFVSIGFKPNTDGDGTTAAIYAEIFAREQTQARLPFHFIAG